MNLTTKLAIAAVLALTTACGGAFDPTSDAGALPGVTAPEPVDEAPNAGGDAGGDAAGWHFVCLFSTSKTYWTEECTTLPDGGPSYTDTQAGIDCRTYMAGAGQGCIAPMSCQTWVDGQQVTGECINQP